MTTASLFDFFLDAGNSKLSNCYTNRYIWKETDTSFVLTDKSLPGLDDISLRLEGRYLTISGIDSGEEQTRNYSLNPSLLDQIERDGVTAEYKKGVLRITFPKKHIKARDIPLSICD